LGNDVETKSPSTMSAISTNVAAASPTLLERVTGFLPG
jgi:hypothetical protein